MRKREESRLSFKKAVTVLFCRRNDKESNGSSLRGNKENQLLADDGGEGARNFKPLRYTPGKKREKKAIIA